MELVSGSLVGDGVKCAAAEVNRNLKVLRGELTELNGAQVAVAVKLVQARVGADNKTTGEATDLKVLNIELTLVDLDLVLEGVVTDAATGISNLLDNLSDLGTVVGKAEDEVAGDGGILVGGKILLIELRDLVDVAELTEGTEEVIGRDGQLALEESKPEDLSALGLELLADLVGEVIVHDIFEVDLIEIVGPRVEHGEALVLDALLAVLLDIFLEELEVSLIGVDRVAKIISIDRLLLVANERANGLDARAGLQILGLDREIEDLSHIVV